MTLTGKDAKQDIRPVLKETPKTPATPSTPAKRGTLPSTGETIQATFALIGLMITAIVGFFFVSKKAENELV
ncbi:LPXTG cell wall anchor domain-containing protein [Enterococcus wangshanyuanii]|uniref:LPXTG cell wall anchor domain-containing protein n=1 Tax=Enterococcus wangshanyuanii TaxID=2005703 RepID=UPI000B4B8A41